MTNLFRSLDIDIWDIIGIWCLEFDIFKYINIRDSNSKDNISIGYSTVKFHISVNKGLQSFNPRMKLHVAGTVNRLNVEHRTPDIER